MTARFTRTTGGTALAIVLFAGAWPQPAEGAQGSPLATPATGVVLNVDQRVQREQLDGSEEVGSTSNGGTVYADGRVVFANGDLLFASNGDGQVCGYGTDVAVRCGLNARAYYPQTYAGREHNDPWGRISPPQPASPQVPAPYPARSSGSTTGIGTSRTF